MADYVTHIKPAPGAESAPIQDPNAIQRTGDTMQADLSMGGFRLTDVGTPELDADAANKAYADKMLPKTGGTMSGTIVMGGNKITGLADPTNDADAATKKYVDNASPKWTLIGSWGYQGSMSAVDDNHPNGFADYEELMFVCDYYGDGFSGFGGGTLHIPTIILRDDVEHMWFGSYTFTGDHFSIEMTMTTAATYGVYIDGYTTSKYTFYCYGR